MLFGFLTEARLEKPLVIDLALTEARLELALIKIGVENLLVEIKDQAKQCGAFSTGAYSSGAAKGRSRSDAKQRGSIVLHLIKKLTSLVNVED